MLDALYALQHQNARPVANNQRWEMMPFSGNWTASIFMSLDGVALESVGVDFLRSEPTQDQIYGSIDNYLQESAMAHDPPSGTVYDPEGDGVPLTSLGVHEHWNNPIDKLYSRNLGTADGIELVTPDMVTAVEAAASSEVPEQLELSNHPNPFNAGTTLTLNLPASGTMQLRVYNALGQLETVVRDEYRDAGFHRLHWDGRGADGAPLRSGMYFAHLSAGGQETVRKVTVVR